MLPVRVWALDCADGFVLNETPMDSQHISFKKKKTGRPSTGRGTLVGVSFRPGLLAALDAYCEQTGQVRTDAVRSLLKLGLVAYNESLSQRD